MTASWTFGSKGWPSEATGRSVSSTAPVSSMMSGSEGEPRTSSTGSPSGAASSPGRFGSRLSSSEANLAALPVLLVLVLDDLGVLYDVVRVGGVGSGGLLLLLLLLGLAVEGLGELVGGR